MRDGLLPPAIFGGVSLSSTCSQNFDFWPRSSDKNCTIRAQDLNSTSGIFGPVLEFTVNKRAIVSRIQWYRAVVHGSRLLACCWSGWELQEACTNNTRSRARSNDHT